MIEGYNFVISLIRWKSWSDTKLVFLFVALGMVILEKSVTDFVSQISIILKFLILFVAYGSFVSISNDFWDRAIDKEAKKLRGVRCLGNITVVIILLIFLSVYLILLTLLAQHRIAILILGIAMVLLGFLYSSPVIRFKEKGWFGVVVGSLIQRTFPLFLVFGILKNFTPTAFLLVVLTFILGLKLMLIHQIEDYPTDLRSKVKTVITGIGLNRGKKIIRFLFVLEILTLLVFLFWGSQTISIRPIAFVYFVFWGLLLLIKPTAKDLIDNFSLNDFFMADFYYVWLPLYTGILVFLRNGDPLLLLILLLFQKKHILIFLRKAFYR